MTQLPEDLSFLLDDFRQRVGHVTHAIGVSADGLVVASTSGLPRDRADQLAAVAAGLTSLLKGASNLLDAGGVISNLTELGRGFLFSMAVSSGASLFVLASRECDIGTVSYEMSELINKVGPSLTPDPRTHVRPDPVSYP